MAAIAAPTPDPKKQGHDFPLEYPYNVAHKYLPVPSDRVPAQLKTLGIQVHPDDSDVITHLPTVQVDYLSPKEWKQECDVWTSWKEMTKHKRNVEDGIRLENASWRTWAQQRNQLKTVSPVTLNWLKDSDVTWLYGPLHEAGEQPTLPTRASSASSTQERLGLDSVAILNQKDKIIISGSNNSSAIAILNGDNSGSNSSSGRSSSFSFSGGASSQRKNSTSCGKPGILKVRTLSDMLSCRPETPLSTNSPAESVRSVAFALPDAK